jgi:hypothetical protein
MSTPEFKKDPSAVLDYSIDWTPWLPSGDTIATSTWVAETGITIDSTANSTTKTTVWLSGGTAGTIYKVTNTITTAGGRTDERTLHIIVTNR